MGQQFRSRSTARAQRTRTATAPLEVGEVIRRVVRRWPTVVITTAVVTLAVLLIAMMLPKTYESVASVSVTPEATLTAAGSPHDPNMPTEVATASSRVVAERASKALVGSNDPALVSELIRNTKVSAPTQSRVLRFAVSADTPDDAARRANALADAYLKDRAEASRTRNADAAKTLEASLAKTDKNDPARVALQEALAEVSVPHSAPGRVIATAHPRSASVNTTLGTALLAGVVGGLLLGTLAALIRDRRAARVSHADRLSQRTGLDVVDALGQPASEAAAAALAEVDTVISPATEATVAVVDPAGAPAASFVAELRDQALPHQVHALDLSLSPTQRRSAALEHQAVVVLVSAQEDLERATSVVGSLQRNRARVIPVLWNATDTTQEVQA